MDFLRNGGQSADNRDIIVCIIRCVYSEELILDRDNTDGKVTIVRRFCESPSFRPAPRNRPSDLHGTGLYRSSKGVFRIERG